MTAEHDAFDTIVIVILLDTLRSDFKAIMANILKTRDKTIQKI